MLSGKEKSRIQAEEVFRREVRRELNAKSTPPSGGRKLWALLNSSFALWFLSSVVVASLTAAVTYFERAHSEAVQKAEHQTRLTTEIAFRVANGVSAAQIDEQRVRAGEPWSPYDVYQDALNYLDNRVFYRGGNTPELIDYSVYTEYRDRKFRSLLVELRNVVDKSSFPSLDDATAEFMKLFDLTAAAQVVDEQPQTRRSAKIEDGEKTLEILKKLQAGDLWRPRT